MKDTIATPSEDKILKLLAESSITVGEYTLDEYVKHIKHAEHIAIFLDGKPIYLGGAANCETSINKTKQLSSFYMKHFKTIGFDTEISFEDFARKEGKNIWDPNEHEKVIDLKDQGFKSTSYSIHDLVAGDPIVIHEEEFQKKIDEFKPDVIALSSMTMSFDFAISLLNRVDCKGAKVIVGGVHATIAPEDALSQSVVDIITIGEADETFPELLTLMQNGEDYTNVKSMHFKMPDGSIKKNPLAARPGVDDLPCPDWDLFDIKHLFRPFDGKIYKGSFYSQSRGCPMSCTYCVDPTIADVTGGNKGYFRFQHPETTYNHLSELKSKYGARWLKFSDDTFLLPKADHLEHLRDLIKPLDILFGCSVMPNTIRENKVDLAKEMGCVAMSVGIESGDPDVRKKLMRHYNNEKLVDNLQMVINKEIRVSTFNIIGFPEENRDQVFKTIELNREIGTSACNVYILYPYPGTPIAIKNKIPLRDQNGKIPTQDIACELGLSEMSSDELRGLLKTFNLYLHINKPLWPIIRLAEKQTETGQKINMILSNLSVSLLDKKGAYSDFKLEKNKIFDVNSVPEELKDLFDLDLNPEDFSIIYDSLKSEFASPSNRPKVKTHKPKAFPRDNRIKLQSVI